MHFLPVITVRNQHLALPLSSADVLDLLATLCADQPDNRRANWYRLLRQSPTLLVWLSTHFPAARNYSDLAQAAACHHVRVLELLTAAPPGSKVVSLGESWLNALEAYFRELNRAGEAMIASAPHLAMSGHAVELGSTSTSTTSLVNRPPNLVKNLAVSRRLVPLFETLIRPFWPGSAEELNRWLTDAYSKFDFGPGLENGTRLEPSPEERLAQQLEAWRTPVEPAHPTLLRDLAEKMLLASRASSDWNAEKLESLKQLAYGASHEINNPLANIATRAQLLVANEKDDARRKQLLTIFQQAMRAHEMISDMMLFAHPPEPTLQPVQLSELLNQACAEFATRVEQAGWTIVWSNNGPPICLKVDVGQIISMLQAIVQNSLESQPSGQITVSCDLLDEETAVIEVGDNGPGVSEQTARHMFDPFYSGREAGRGLGFGLSKAWTIARLHGGELSVKSTGPIGTILLIQLPIDK